MNTTASDVTVTNVRMDGRVWAVTTYVDPFPGRDGLDKVEVRSTCARCGGSGIFTWHNAMGKCQGTCFLCFGVGTTIHHRAIRSIRRDAKVDAVWAEHGDTIRAESAARYAEAEAVKAAADFADDWDAAHAEQDRRAALVTGFVAPVGDKIDATGTVTVATTYERRSFNGYGVDTIALVVVTLDGGQVVKATGTGRTLYRCERGERVRITGTVKGHDTYQGQDQTTLTRAKIADA